MTAVRCGFSAHIGGASHASSQFLEYLPLSLIG
jgi:hypothetical protein